MAPIPEDPNMAQAWITGDPPDQTIDFYIPRGNQGVQGPVGPIGPSLSVGNIETVTGPAAPGTVGAQGLTGPQGPAGGITQGILLTDGANLNELVSDGLWRVAGVTLVNAPPATQLYGTFMVVTTQGSSRVIQTFYPQASGEGGRVFFQRIYAGGTWYGWYTFNSTRVSNAAGRAIYQWDNIAARDQLIYGDTGWRRVQGELLNGWTGSDVRIRRTGTLVSLRIFSLVGTAATANTFYQLPSGWFDSGSNLQMGLPGSSTVLNRNSNGELQLPTGTSYQSSYNTEFSWVVTTSWPTTLPGVASNSIPNA